jgi:hypothetical protein
MFRSAADGVVCKSLKIDKTMVGSAALRRPVGAVRRPLPFGARQPICAIPATKIMPNVLRNLNLTII